MSLLELHDLSVVYPSRRGLLEAVSEADLAIEPGQIHGLVGESGAGKSTVGAAIMGLIDPPGGISGGTIRFRGDTISAFDARAMRRLRGSGISMIFQDPLTALNPLLTVGDQIVETMRQHLDLSQSEAEDRARDLLARVGIPDPKTRIDQYPHQFSGGMRQRVVIALALCSEPEVIIADEPTTALDVSIQAQILELLRDLARERQVGILLVTHDMGVIAEVTDVVTVMYKGRVVESGPTAKILGQPDHPYTQALIAAVPRPDKKMHRFPLIAYGGGLPRIDVNELGGGWTAPDTDGPLVELRGITKRFLERGSIIPSRRRHFTAVDDVSFDIRTGEVFGLVGESGSGKSTIARMIAALYPLDGGEVRFDGTPVHKGADRATLDLYRRQIQMIFQDPFSSLNPRMRVADIVAEPLRHLAGLSGRDVRKRVDGLLDGVGLGTAAGPRYPHEFSGGQRQRISIARALATRPRFLICDEPTSALDVSIQAQILNVLKDLQEELNLTMLFISHDLPVVRQMCDRIGVLKDGRLVELAETETLFRAPQHPYTQELLRLMPKFAGPDTELG
ncbi:ABC transporter ATP-binding protein [Palleronia sp.]|uniref:ABC transporter ATP-binding protein n=1 Tax=Palleronia sp. TaxID=1940284 RepID=UPI0035C7DD3F